nr:unnamed protein product [Callosobruchus analis]
MLALMHETHFGIEKTKQRARQIFYWPGMSSDVEQFIYKCEVCQTNRRSQQKETLVPHEMPSRPWQYIFSDFFEFQSKNFILLIDSYSNWIEVEQTKSKTAEEVINFCKNKFKQFGVPEIFFADNVPFNSSKFREFARKYNLKLDLAAHITINLMVLLKVLRSVEPNHSIPESVKSARCLAFKDTHISKIAVYLFVMSGSSIALM